jgi:hypothetical protein
VIALELVQVIETPEKDTARDVDMLFFRILDGETAVCVDRGSIFEQKLEAEVGRYAR